MGIKHSIKRLYAKPLARNECRIVVAAVIGVGLMRLKERWALSLIVNFVTWNSRLSQPRDSIDSCPASHRISVPGMRRAGLEGRPAADREPKAEASRAAWPGGNKDAEFGQQFQRATVTKRQNNVFFWEVG